MGGRVGVHSGQPCLPDPISLTRIVYDGGGGGNRTPVRAGYAMRPSPSNPRTPPKPRQVRMSSTVQSGEEATQFLAYLPLPDYFRA